MKKKYINRLAELIGNSKFEVDDIFKLIGSRVVYRSGYSVVPCIIKSIVIEDDGIKLSLKSNAFGRARSVTKDLAYVFPESQKGSTSTRTAGSKNKKQVACMCGDKAEKHGRHYYRCPEYRKGGRLTRISRPESEDED